jgi:hypothetical protein
MTLTAVLALWSSSRAQPPKGNGEDTASGTLVSLGRYAPFALTSMFVRLAFSLPQRAIVTVTTNVPGPQQPLYALDRRLVEISPYVPIATTLRTGAPVSGRPGTPTRSEASGDKRKGGGTRALGPVRPPSSRPRPDCA